VSLPRDELERGLPAFKLFVLSGLSSSNSVARHLIRGGGARLNDLTLADETRLISTTDLTTEGFIKLSAGRKRHALVKPK
jgi:tyrosyl-tRNA synthetase